MRRRQLALCLIVLGVFALYAPALRLMLIHDDANVAIWLNSYTPLSIFTANYATSGSAARPMSNIWWILTRDLFGWYHPPLIHAWNVWLHALNVALIGSLAARLGRRLDLHGLLYPILVALVFGLFPLTYQGIIWASAIVHPAMTVFGLAAIHASLTASQRNSKAVWAISLLLVLGACLSHEAGFLFGLAVLLVNGILAVSTRANPSMQHPTPNPSPLGRGAGAASSLLPLGEGLGVGKSHWQSMIGAIGVTIVSLAYAMLNRIIAMQAGLKNAGLRPLDEITSNAVYFMQAMVTWPVIVLRPIVGLSDASLLIIAALFVLCVVLMLFALWRMRLGWLGALGVLWFLLMASLPILVLDAAYVSYGPRLLYAASVGIALLWGTGIAGVVHHLRSPIAKTLVLAISAVLLAWGVPYITERTAETERLTPAMWSISDDQRDHTQPDANVLFVNMPWWNAPANPSFLVGAEGMPIFQHEGAPAWTWIAANSAVQRETQYVRHPASLTQDPRWVYGQPGPDLDDAALRERMLRSNAIYAFDYDAPGLRSQRVALIAPAQGAAPQDFIAALQDGNANYYITRAEARQCKDEIVLDMTWQRDGDASQSLGVFVHGMDAGGNQVVTADKDLLNGALPLDQLPPMLSVNERRIIALPTNAPALASINIGAYRRSDVVRLQATNAGGARLVGDQVSISVRHTFVGTTGGCP